MPDFKHRPRQTVFYGPIIQTTTCCTMNNVDYVTRAVGPLKPCRHLMWHLTFPEGTTVYLSAVCLCLSWYWISVARFKFNQRQTCLEWLWFSRLRIPEKVIQFHLVPMEHKFFKMSQKHFCNLLFNLSFQPLQVFKVKWPHISVGIKAQINTFSLNSY